MRRITFHCRFGGQIGWGHVIRCSALAEAAQDRGWETTLCSSSSASVLNAETRAAFDVRVGGERSDLEAVLKTADVLWVDEMYWADPAFEDLARLAKANDCLFAATDDMQQRRLACADLILNPEPGLEVGDYGGSGTRLLGERYCLTRRAFRSDSVESEPEFSSEALPVLVMIGGADAVGATGAVLDVLAGLEGLKFAPIVVTGESSDRGENIERKLSLFDEYKWFKRLDSMKLARWMRASPLAIIGCGSSIFELAALRVPFVGLALVDNQMRSAAAIRRSWEIPVVEFDVETPVLRRRLGGKIEKCVRKMDTGWRPCFDSVDGNGVERVMREIEALISKK